MYKLTMGQWLMFGMLVAILTCGWALPAPDVSNRGIADALKALEKLDRYYSHVAMPRCLGVVRTKDVLVVGSLRSDRAFAPVEQLSPDVENALSIMRLHQLDKMYSDRIRPRFGKRTESVYENSDYDGPAYQSLKEWLASSAGR